MLSTRLDFRAGENEFSRLLAEKRRLGVSLCDLTESNPTRVGITYPEDWADALAAGASTYDPSPRGLPSARAAVAEHYAQRGVAVDADDIVLTASTSEAYALLFKLLCDPGDRVLAPQPGYPLLDPIAALEGVRLDRYPLRGDDGWGVDLATLGARIDARTRAIVLVHPNNPTGSFVKRRELAAVRDLCERHDLALISDEVFSDYAFAPDAERAGPLAAEASVPSFSLGGLSKSCGLPQVKVGWILVNGPPSERRRLLDALEHVNDAYLSCSGPAQHALGALLGLRHTVGAAILARIRDNRAWLAASGADLLAAEGGWYAVLRLPDGVSDDRFVLDLLEHDDVVVHPGYFYDFAEARFVVISLLVEPETLRSGISRLLARSAVSR